MRLEPVAFAFVLVLLGGCAAPGTRSLAGEATPAQEAAALQVKLGQEYLRKGDLETARDKLQRALQLDPRSVDAHTVMGLLSERIGRPEAAEHHYRKAVELKPEDGAVNNNLGVFLCGQGRYAEADRHFRAALKDPFYRTPAAALANAGVCRLQDGDDAGAEDYLRRTLEVDRNNLIALAALAGIAHRKGEDLRARAFLQRYQALAELDAALLRLGIEVEQGLGDEQAAGRYLEELRRRFPDSQAPAGPSGGSSP
ncbi:MAG: type IV pilus biogenesis/stability protein PilW [Lysobacteraceae bacterium]|nr:MAG: type IV pilus biogenesis/stability protein PilW [Xanthomonadaceae bacterium]